MTKFILPEYAYFKDSKPSVVSLQGASDSQTVQNIIDALKELRGGAGSKKNIDIYSAIDLEDFSQFSAHFEKSVKAFSIQKQGQEERTIDSLSHFRLLDGKYNLIKISLLYEVLKISTGVLNKNYLDGRSTLGSVIAYAQTNLSKGHELDIGKLQGIIRFMESFDTVTNRDQKSRLYGNSRFLLHSNLQAPFKKLLEGFVISSA